MKQKTQDTLMVIMGMLVLIVFALMYAREAMSADRYEDNITYTTTVDGKGNLTTTGSDGSRAFSAKCQTCARRSYDTVYSDGSRSRTEQNGTNDDYTTTVTHGPN